MTASDSSAEQDSELRLRELTDQTLLLLEQLATARQRAHIAEAERKQWHQAYAKLQARLTDVKSRLRSASSLRIELAPGVEAAPDLCETFICADGSVAGEARDRWFSALRRFLERSPATLIVPRHETPSEGILGIMSGVRVLECEGDRPAALWNLALATSRAPMVLIVGPGAIPTRVRLADLAMFTDPEVAVAQPALQVGRDGPVLLGLDGGADLRLRPRRRQSGATDELEDLPFAHPALFAVCQQAVIDVGPFDQDLSSELALAEFCLRARAAGLRIVGVPAQRGELTRAVARRSFDPLERDHLIVLARHRPQDLQKALAQSAELWHLSDAERAEVVGALLRRLPGAADWPTGVEVAMQSICALARETVPWDHWADHLRRIGDALGVALDPESNATQPAILAQAVEAIVERGANLAAGEGEAARARELAAANVDLDARLAASEQREHELRSACESLQHSLEVHDRLRADAERNLAAVRAEMGRQHEQALATAASIDALRSALRRALRASADASDAWLVERIHNLRSLLAAREGWLASVLREKAHRRLRLRPHLDAAEQRFLDEHTRSGDGTADG